jgi:hypothetical protein
MKNGDMPREVKEDFMVILTYLASASMFLILSFTVIYIFYPKFTEDYVYVSVNFPLAGLFNNLLNFIIHSINNLFTYIFLTIVGIVSYLGAEQYEEEMKAEDEYNLIKEAQEKEFEKSEIDGDVETTKREEVRITT